MAMISHFRYPVFKARGKGFKPYKFLFSGYPVSLLYLTSEEYDTMARGQGFNSLEFSFAGYPV